MEKRQDPRKKSNGNSLPPFASSTITHTNQAQISIQLAGGSFVEREHSKESTRQQLNNLTSSANAPPKVSGAKVPGLNMEIVQKKSERQKLINEMIKGEHQNKPVHTPSGGNLHQNGKSYTQGGGMYGAEQGKGLGVVGKRKNSMSQKMGKIGNSNQLQGVSGSAYVDNDNQCMAADIDAVDSARGGDGQGHGLLTKLAKMRQKIKEMEVNGLTNQSQNLVTQPQLQYPSRTTAQSSKGVRSKINNQNAASHSQNGWTNTRRRFESGSMQVGFADEPQVRNTGDEFSENRKKLNNQLQDLHMMGNEIAQLKTQQRRTKSSIQKMKTFYARKSVKVPRKEANNNILMSPFFDMSSESERSGKNSNNKEPTSIPQPVTNYSRHAKGYLPYGQTHNTAVNRNSNASNLAEAKQSLRKKQSKASSKSKANLEQSKRELPGEFENLHKVDSKLDVLQQKLRDCKREGGLVDPSLILNALNMACREEDPEAYEPEIVIQHRKKQEVKRMEKLLEQEKAQMVYDADKALFDFDDSIDNLSIVSDRYPAQRAANDLAAAHATETAEEKSEKDFDKHERTITRQSVELNKNELKNEIIKDLTAQKERKSRDDTGAYYGAEKKCRSRTRTLKQTNSSRFSERSMKEARALLAEDENRRSRSRGNDAVVVTSSSKREDSRKQQIRKIPAPCESKKKNELQMVETKSFHMKGPIDQIRSAQARRPPNQILPSSTKMRPPTQKTKNVARVNHGTTRQINKVVPNKAQAGAFIQEMIRNLQNMSSLNSQSPAGGAGPVDRRLSDYRNIQPNYGQRSFQMTSSQQNVPLSAHARANRVSYSRPITSGNSSQSTTGHGQMLRSSTNGSGVNRRPILHTEASNINMQQVTERATYTTFNGSGTQENTQNNQQLTNALSEITLRKKANLQANQRNVISATVGGNHTKPPVFIQSQAPPAGYKLTKMRTTSTAKQRQGTTPQGKLFQSGGPPVIGSQLHINRLKRFYCENLDKQSSVLVEKLNYHTTSNEGESMFTPNHGTTPSQSLNHYTQLKQLQQDALQHHHVKAQSNATNAAFQQADTNSLFQLSQAQAGGQGGQHHGGGQGSQEKPSGLQHDLREYFSRGKSASQHRGGLTAKVSGVPLRPSRAGMYV